MDVFQRDSSQLPLTVPYDTDEIFKVMGSKFKVTDKITIKMHFSSEGIPVCGSLLKTFYCSLSLYVFHFCCELVSLQLIAKMTHYV